MKRRVFYQSDQHIDFLVGGHNTLKEEDFLSLTTNMLPQDDVSNDILVLAGDMWIGKRSLSWAGHSWIRHVSQMFYHVIVVLGNHDRWEGCLGELDASFKKDLLETGITNVSLLENDFWEDAFTNTLFVGATLWTDMNKANVLTMFDAPNTMVSDFKYTRAKGYKRFRADDWCKEHRESVKYIDLLCGNSPDKKIIVVTHHAPSYSSVHHKYRGQSSNHYYASSLEWLMQDRENISHWIHGHTHDSFNYFVDKCNVLCNPYGYRGENIWFNPNAHFEIGE